MTLKILLIKLVLLNLYGDVIRYKKSCHKHEKIVEFEKISTLSF